METTMKLYVAVLNSGWVRRELVTMILPRLYATPGVYVQLENLEESYAHPICSNRSKITRRFLETDCDYLLMIDDDIVPVANPADLVHTGKDVIGCPAKVRKNTRTTVWVAYKEVDGLYAPVDIMTTDQNADLLEVDAVGSGCILVKRSVLEKLGPAGWQVEFDEDGVCKTGTDIVFCKRAKEAGFEVYCAHKYVCEHFKELGMLGLAGMDDIDFSTAEANKYDMGWGGFAIEHCDWNWLKQVFFEHDIYTVLEFGAGLSTLVMSEHVVVHSLETDREWALQIGDKCTTANDAMIMWWDNESLPAGIGNNNYGVVFIDGPKSKLAGGPGREQAFKHAVTLSDLIIVHDSGRSEEVELQNRYLKPDFELVGLSGYQPTRMALWRRK
jgi:hypothetical protein